MKVYLDNDMVSGIATGDMPEDVESALMQILELKDTVGLELVTSEVTLKEIENYTGEDKRILRIVCFLIEKVRSAPTVPLIGFPRFFPFFPDPIYSQLRALLKEKDALHVFQAIKNRVNVFLTLDGGILARKGEIKRWNMDVLKPNELLEKLDSNHE